MLGVQTEKKQWSVPDGAFLVKVNDAQIVYVFRANVRSSVLPPQTSTCRAPSRAFFDPTPCTWQGNVANARRHLDGYKEVAKQLFPTAEIVKVYGYQGITLALLA